MIIPGVLISLLTFPGVVVHELAHQIFCMLCGLRVFEVKYFQMGNPNGYVIHESTDRPWKVFLTCMGPFFINSVLGMVILLPASISLMVFREYNNPLYLLLGWLGFSILMHAFPSRGDAKVMINRILKDPDVSLLWKVIAAPFVGLIYVCSIGSIFWLDLLYAAVLAMLIPWCLVQIL
ncbi:metalloprotease family protein [Candidatus Merdisoma sp. JLR.KK006]|jgi:hypothetical protein|uniref:metalloprotease family protein n=1 Tax=Candidatus Merdisoma sp. JLR.KK006 TaxID=3112626 RepID=UPI002FF2A317